MGRKRLVEILAVGALLVVLSVAAGGLFYFHRLNEELRRAAASGNVKAVRSLLDRGADVRTRTRYGETPLALAARRGSEKTVRLLLERGADPNAMDVAGATALWWVAARDGVMPNRAALAGLLLSHGADANAHGTGRITTLSYAAAKGDPELVRLLIQHGADVDASDRFGYTAAKLARRTAYSRAAGQAFYQRLAAEAPPSHRPGMSNLLDSARNKRLDAEATVRILKRAGATKQRGG